MVTDYQPAKQSIVRLLDDLTIENLQVVERFVRFLHVESSHTPQHPTTMAPASSLVAWTQLLEHGYEGDALTDTEANEEV